ncbi:hypothetical protein Neosp_009051 [[Neocosmospora] mangrovei]
MSAGSGMLIFLLVVQLSATWDTETHVFFICTLHDYTINAEDYLDCIVSLTVPIVILSSTISIVRLLYAPARSGDAGGPRQYGNEATISSSRERRYGNVTRRRTPGNGDANHERLEPRNNQVRGTPSDQPTETPRDKNNQCYYSVDDTERMQQQKNIGNRQHEDVTTREVESQQTPKVHSRFITGLFEATRPSKRERLLGTWLQKKATAFLASAVASGPLLDFKIDLVAESWAFHQCQGSFVWKMLWLWSGNVYGIAAVFTARAYTMGMSGDRDKMGFGQIVPLALLVLPLFAALQSKADYEERLKSHDGQQAQKDHTGPQSRRSSGPVEEPSLNSITLSSNTPERPLTKHLARLEDKSIQLGRLYLFDWATGSSLESSVKLQSYVFLHTGLMFAFTTLLGFFMAFGKFPMANLVLSIIFVLLTVRKVAGLMIKFWYTRSESNFTSDGMEYQKRETGDHSYQMAVATAAEGAEGAEENR